MDLVKKWKYPLLLSCILAYMLWLYYEDYLNQQKVISGYELVSGKIISFSSVGTMNNRYLTYSYIVNGVVYSKETYVPGSLFPKCEYDLDLCTDKRLWVAYQKDDPSNSLINLYIEIQDINTLKKPQTLENFI